MGWGRSPPPSGYATAQDSLFQLNLYASKSPDTDDHSMPLMTVDTGLAFFLLNGVCSLTCDVAADLRTVAFSAQFLPWESQVQNRGKNSDRGSLSSTEGKVEGFLSHLHVEGELIPRAETEPDIHRNDFLQEPTNTPNTPRYPKNARNSGAQRKRSVQRAKNINGEEEKCSKTFQNKFRPTRLSVRSLVGWSDNLGSGRGKRSREKASCRNSF